MHTLLRPCLYVHLESQVLLIAHLVMNEFNVESFQKRWVSPCFPATVLGMGDSTAETSGIRKGKKLAECKSAT